MRGEGRTVGSWGYHVVAQGWGTVACPVGGCVRIASRVGVDKRMRTELDRKRATHRKRRAKGRKPNEARGADTQGTKRKHTRTDGRRRRQTPTNRRRDVRPSMFGEQRHRAVHARVPYRCKWARKGATQRPPMTARRHAASVTHLERDGTCATQTEPNASPRNPPRTLAG